MSSDSIIPSPLSNFYTPISSSQLAASCQRTRIWIWGTPTPTPTASASATHSHLSVVRRSFALPVAVAPLCCACARYHHPPARRLLCCVLPPLTYIDHHMHHIITPSVHRTPPSPLTNVDPTWIRQLRKSKSTSKLVPLAGRRHLTDISLSSLFDCHIVTVIYTHKSTEF